MGVPYVDINPISLQVRGCDVRGNSRSAHSEGIDSDHQSEPQGYASINNIYEEVRTFLRVPLLPLIPITQPEMRRAISSLSQPAQLRNSSYDELQSVGGIVSYESRVHAVSILI